GGVGNDTLSGGGEPDTLNGGAGVDSVSGDAGADRIEVTSNEAESDTMTGGADLDELFFLAGGGAVVLSGFDVATTSLESIQANNQALMGNAAANTFNFTAVQLLQLSHVDAAGGNDIVQGSAGNDIIFGGDGDDNLTGAAGADQIDGGNGTDSVYGGGGDDSVGGGSGNDYVEGNDGNDVLMVRGSEAIFDTMLGGANTDRILNTGGSSITMASISGISMQIEIWDNAGFALLGTNAANLFDLRLDLTGTTTFQMLNTPNINLLGGNDTVYGTNYDDFLIGGLGNDSLYGLTGNDTQKSASSDVTITVGAPDGTTPVVTCGAELTGAQITKPTAFKGSVFGGAWRVELALGDEETFDPKELR
ncbi:MAG TPA: calcium-binding protein, partial [Pirellulaceae bacterium]|nr:calcium-binding protein [Pirellulaceae bacterium]